MLSDCIADVSSFDALMNRIEVGIPPPAILLNGISNVMGGRLCKVLDNSSSSGRDGDMSDDRWASSMLDLRKKRTISLLGTRTLDAKKARW